MAPAPLDQHRTTHFLQLAMNQINNEPEIGIESLEPTGW